MSYEQKLLDIIEIQVLILYCYLFLLVDKVVLIDYDKCIIVVIKNVSINEFFFQGYFLGQLIMFGVLIIEVMVQVGGVFIQFILGCDVQFKLFYMVKVDKVCFSKQVVFGDVLEMYVEIKCVICNMVVYDCVVKVDGEIVVCVEVLCVGICE